MPRSVRNGERLESSVRFVSPGFIPSTGEAGLDVVYDVLAHVRPVVVAGSDFECFTLAWVSHEFVVVVVAQNAET